MSDRNANVNFSVRGADISKQDIDKIRKAAEDFGDKGKAAAQGLSAAFANVERASERVTQKISDGSAVTVRDGNRIIQNFEVLKLQIERAFGSIAHAPVEIQQAYAKAEAQFHSTTATVKTMTTATRENQQAILGNTAQWGGFEQQLLKMVGADGAIGKTIIGLGGIAAAFTGGWEAGQKLNKLFGTDMSVWEDDLKEFGKKAKVALAAVADDLVALGSLIADTFNFKKLAKNGFDTYWTDLKASYLDYHKTIDESAAKLNNLTQAVKDEEAQHLKNEVAQAKAAEAADKLKEAKKKLQDEIEHVAASLKAETIELEKQKGIAEDASLAVIDQSNQQSYLKRQVDDATAALATQRAEVQRLTTQFGASDPMTRAAIERQQQLEKSLGDSQQRYTQTSEEVRKYEEQQRSAQAAVATGTAAQAKDTAALRVAETELAKTTGTATQHAAAVQSAATATESHATAADHATRNTITFRGKTVDLTPEVAKLATHAQAAADATHGMASGTQAATTALASAATGFAGLDSVLPSTAAHLATIDSLLVSIAANADRARRSMKAFADLETGSPPGSPSSPGLPEPSSNPS
jgi:hypothetical protein